MDNKLHFVELMVDNILWGNVTIDWKQVEMHEEKNKTDLTDNLSHYLSLRENSSDKSKITADMVVAIDDLFLALEAHRIFGAINGVLLDRDHDNKIQNLTKDNVELVNAVAKQKEELDEIIGKTTDPKNIRGIG